MTELLSVRRDLPHFVYEFLNAQGEHLYIGCSSKVGNRIASWASAPWWPEVVRIEVDVYPNQRAGLDGERALIEQYAPIHNTVHTERYDAGGWTGRRARQAQAHADGVYCSERSCADCRERAHASFTQCASWPACGVCSTYTSRYFIPDDWRELRPLPAGRNRRAS